MIAVFRSLEGESLEDFTHRLASTWKIGQEDRDNGVVVAVFLDDRKVRLEVGYGLEGSLPDIVCGRIIREEIAPRFRDGDHAGGLRAAVEKIIAATKGEYRADDGGEPASWVDGLTFHTAVASYVVVLLVGWGLILARAPDRSIGRFLIVAFVSIHFTVGLWEVFYVLPGRLFAGDWAGVLFMTVHGGMFFLIPLVFLAGAIFGTMKGGRGGSWSSGGGGWSGGGGGSSSFGGGGGSFGGGGASGGW